MSVDHNAVDATLGYYFQTLYALVVLLKAADDELVTVELTDDVTLHHSVAALDTIEQTRYQVAHSTNPSLPELTIKSTKLWKTLRIWSSEYSEKEFYFLLTCAPVNEILKCLADETDRASLQTALEIEATTVIAENGQKIHDHKERIEGCREFLKLAPAHRSALLARIRICANGPSITDIDQLIGSELRNITRPEKRQTVVKRLREYWINRVCVSLAGEAPRHITKGELQRLIEELVAAMSGEGLPDDFSMMQPPADEEAPDMMRRQIELVNGGNNRVNRAKIARWKSRNQRQRWLEDDVSISVHLNRFDQQLVNTWNDHHGPMCDDTATATEPEKQVQGCALLDWCHFEAPQQAVTLGTSAVPAFVTQGTYQDMANDVLIGWHPEFKTRLKRTSSSPGETKCEQ